MTLAPNMHSKPLAWWKKATAYQIYPRSFYDTNQDGIGDINGIIAKLDYLADLGIDLIWICPFYASPNDDNGYDISDYQAIHPDFGTLEDVDELISAAHKRGIRIIMDLVITLATSTHGSLNLDITKIALSAIGIFGVMVVSLPLKNRLATQTTGKVFFMAVHGNMIKKLHSTTCTYFQKNNLI